MGDAYSNTVIFEAVAKTIVEGMEQLDKADKKLDKFDGRHVEATANVNTKGANKNLEKTEKTAQKTTSSLSDMSLEQHEYFKNASDNALKAKKAIEQINQSNKKLQGRGGKTYLDYFTSEARAVDSLKESWRKYNEESSKGEISNTTKNALLRDTRVAQALGVDLAATFSKDEAKKIKTAATKQFNKNKNGKSGNAGLWNLEDVTKTFDGVKDLARLGYEARQIIDRTGAGLSGLPEIKPGVKGKLGFINGINRIREQAGVKSTMPDQDVYDEYIDSIKDSIKAEQESAESLQKESKQKDESAEQTKQTNKKQKKKDKEESNKPSEKRPSGPSEPPSSKPPEKPPSEPNKPPSGGGGGGTFNADKIRRNSNNITLIETQNGKTIETPYTRNKDTGEWTRGQQQYAANYEANMKKAAKYQADIHKKQEQITQEMGKVSPDESKLQKYNNELSILQNGYDDCVSNAKAFMRETETVAARLGQKPSKTMQSFNDDVAEVKSNLLGTGRRSKGELSLLGAADEFHSLLKTYSRGGLTDLPYATNVIENFQDKAMALSAGGGASSDVYKQVNQQTNDLIKSVFSGHIARLKRAAEKNGTSVMQDHAQNVVNDFYAQTNDVAYALMRGDKFDLSKRMSQMGNMLTNAIPVADQSKLNSLNANIQKALTNNSSMNMQYANQLKAISNIIKGSGGNMTYSAMSDLQSRYHGIMAEVGDAGQLGKSFWGSFTDRIKSGSAQFIARYFSLYQVVDWAKQAAAAITDVNSKMIELKKVSNASDFDLAKSLKVSEENAQDLGATVSDVVSATADWSRLGYNLPDAQELGRVATLYKNVGDGITIDDANESLISTLQGFQLDASQSESIVDKINEVANNFPIDSGGIGEALQRSAASFNAAHTDLSKSIALVTTTNSVVQDPDVVGTMWKTDFCFNVQKCA